MRVGCDVNDVEALRVRREPGLDALALVREHVEEAIVVDFPALLRPAPVFRLRLAHPRGGLAGTALVFVGEPPREGRVARSVLATPPPPWQPRFAAFTKAAPS